MARHGLRTRTHTPCLAAGVLLLQQLNLLKERGSTTLKFHPPEPEKDNIPHRPHDTTTIQLAHAHVTGTRHDTGHTIHTTIKQSARSQSPPLTPASPSWSSQSRREPTLLQEPLPDVLNPQPQNPPVLPAWLARHLSANNSLSSPRRTAVAPQ